MAQGYRYLWVRHCQCMIGYYVRACRTVSEGRSARVSQEAFEYGCRNLGDVSDQQYIYYDKFIIYLLTTIYTYSTIYLPLIIYTNSIPYRVIHTYVLHTNITILNMSLSETTITNIYINTNIRWYITNISVYSLLF